MLRNLPPLGNAATSHQLALAIHLLARGASFPSGTFTLDSGTTTTVTNEDMTEEAVPVWIPITANGAAALTGLYLSDRNNGDFVLTHAAATTSATYIYVILPGSVADSAPPSGSGLPAGGLIFTHPLFVKD